MVKRDTSVNSATIVAPAVGCEIPAMPLRLAEMMVRRRLNAYQLAQKLDGRVNRSSVYRMVRGDKVKLSAEEIEAVCDVLAITPNELYGWGGRHRT